MFKKFISMATAAILFGTGLSVIAAAPASASTTFTINCLDTSNLTEANGWEVASMGQRYATDGTGFQKFIVLNPTGVYNFNTSNCRSIRPTLPANSTTGTIALTGTRVSSGSTNNALISGGYDTNDFVVTAGSTIPTLPISGGGSDGRNTITFKREDSSSSTVAVTFIDAVTGANADLAQLTDSGGQLLSGFSPSTTTYNVTRTSSTFGSTRTVASIFSQPVARRCNGTLMSDNNFSCALNMGANVFTATIVGLDGVTTKVYTVNITRNEATAGGSSSPAICSADLLSSSSTIKGVAFNKGTRQATINNFNGQASRTLGGSVTLTPAQASGTGITAFTATAGATVTWLYITPTRQSWQESDISTTDNLQNVTLDGPFLYIKVSGSGCADFYFIRIIVEGGSDSSSSPSAQQAAAAAAQAQAAAVLAAAIARAKVVLTAQFAANKPATAEQFLDAGYVVRNNNVAAKVSSAVLKLSAADRENTQKVNEIINLENFIDRVAVTDTRSTVRASELISRGLLPADSTKKHSVIRGLGTYPNGSLDSLEKIAAAVKEQIFKAEEPKRRLAEIRARMAARRG